VYFDEIADAVDCPVYARDALRPGDTFTGPAIVEQMDSTVMVPPGQAGRVDDALNLVLTSAARS
jgi:N-methylhydantoinase A